MTVSVQALFSHPQSEIATLIQDRLAKSDSTSIVTGFATPAGLELISTPIESRPGSLNAFVVGAVTYPALDVLDDLLSAGVSGAKLRIHNGHTIATRGRRNPFARYHPMLHSKIYYMELPGSRACAFVGSHNVTLYALGGYNGEAAVLLEGDIGEQVFKDIRSHVAVAIAQSQVYSQAFKEAYAWWFREYLEGLRAEISIPSDWISRRTILIFAEIGQYRQPMVGDSFYFEMPAGISQIRALETEVHLFLFKSLPPNPYDALNTTSSAHASYRCITEGADNTRGMIEVDAAWRVDTTTATVLLPVPGGRYRPSPPPSMQQVRATIREERVDSLEYSFETKQEGWVPLLSHDETIPLRVRVRDRAASSETKGRGPWQLVKGFSARERLETDQQALEKASPESGSFILVALRIRSRSKIPDVE